MDRPKIRREWYRTNTQKADSVTIAFMTVPYSATLVGQRIRYYRLNLGLSQEKLAELSGCHPTYVGQLERGEKMQQLKASNGSLLRSAFLFPDYLRKSAMTKRRRKTSLGIAMNFC